jgi:hypothetical protein
MHLVGRRILLVGAFERDNFGDLLYLLLSRHYFRSAAVSAAAPIAADMSDLVDQRIEAYGPLLRRHKFDHVWTVGGEVGGVTPASAFKMSAPPHLLELFATSPDREQVLREAFGGPLPASPYVPGLVGYPRNLFTRIGVNSVGLSAAEKLSAPSRYSLLSTLRRARPVSVRDAASSRYLTKQRVSHSLVPDLVHSIAVTHRTRPSNNSDYAVVQASEEFLASVSEDAFTRSIASLSRREGLNIRFFAAGTASGHDSFSAYRRLAAVMRRTSPEISISVSKAQRPWDRVEEIRRAGLWLGTSLHGRIVACAYGVPRVSLDVDKVNTYAGTWDYDMPYGVQIGDIEEAATSARYARGHFDLAHGRELGEMADNHMKVAVGSTLAGEFDLSLNDRLITLVDMTKSGIHRRLLECTSPQYRRGLRKALATVGCCPPGRQW